MTWHLIGLTRYVCACGRVHTWPEPSTWCYCSCGRCWSLEEGGLLWRVEPSPPAGAP